MIQLTGLTKRHGEVLAVDDLTFTVRPGLVTGFPGLARSVSVARHCVRSVLAAAGHQNVDGALLVVSELVGNAVVHTVSGLAGGLVTVDIREIGQNMARIDVIDQGASTAPQVCESSDTASSGRGLRLVEETAVRWGVRDDSLGGKAVWAEVLTTEDTPVALIDASIWAVEEDAKA
ncbi:ATP-binding protein [Nonomuraea sp. K274]|uniref:ATP-binding protein n=1 Tax=Nonomuraea cypriaca TaxID=1187855 RepID=A0A931ABV0_9ACTN|nr:ATP-binding protein [Nonomuraea cypriaca]MBF8186467.1 ATP-binding protein [Nonomuraea cypriaca]